MAGNHVFFTVHQITRTGFAIRYTPQPLGEADTDLHFSMACDVLIAGESLATKQATMQLVADILNRNEAWKAERKEQSAAALDKIEASLKFERKLTQAASNLLAVLTPEGEEEQLAAQKLAELLGPEAGANV